MIFNLAIALDIIILVSVVLYMPHSFIFSCLESQHCCNGCPPREMNGRSFPLNAIESALSEAL